MWFIGQLLTSRYKSRFFWFFRQTVNHVFTHSCSHPSFLPVGFGRLYLLFFLGSGWPLPIDVVGQPMSATYWADNFRCLQNINSEGRACWNSSIFLSRAIKCSLKGIIGKFSLSSSQWKCLWDVSRYFWDAFEVPLEYQQWRACWNSSIFLSRAIKSSLKGIIGK